MNDRRALWTLDPSVTFLNHGSFGATPRAVLDVQNELRARMESQPVRFFIRDLEGLLDEAREALAAFVGASADDLAFVANATTGVNTVLQSLKLERDDELLTTDHEYNACRNALDVVAQRHGAKVTVATVPFPIASPAQVLDALLQQCTARTRLLLIDHVTSPTGLVFPIESIVHAFRARGIDVLVDGAHAPGMLPLDLRTLGATYYTGNAHKWICAPKSAALLYVARERQAQVRPLVISHGANAQRTDRSRFRLEHDWTGTTDVTPFLALPTAIRVMGALHPGGWPALREHNRALVLRARAHLASVLNTTVTSPDEMIGSLATLFLPPRPAGLQRTRDGLDPLQDALWFRHKIEVPIVPWSTGSQRMIRISAQHYNAFEDYVRLGDALREELSRERSMD